jgi:hypothetical protein
MSIHNINYNKKELEKLLNYFTIDSIDEFSSTKVEKIAKWLAFLNNKSKENI